MASFLLGKDAKAYYSTTLLDAGANDVATVLASASVADNIMDLSLDVESDFVETTTRAEAANGFASRVAVLKNGQITFDARWNPDDAAWFTALKNAWVNNTEIAFFALDQAKATVGAQGLAANFTVSFTKEEPLNDIQKVSVTLNVSTYPEWYTVPA